MNSSSHLEQKIAQIIEMARYAPSINNTQPWIIKVNGNSIEIQVDERYALVDGDPTTRQTYISLGIFCEALAIAAENDGFSAQQIDLGKLQARVWVTESSKSDITAAKHQTELLRRRCTDRSVYKPTDISSTIAKRIESSAGNYDAKVFVVTDHQIIGEIAESASKGMSLALSSPNFRKELSHYLLLPWSSRKRGIAVRSLYIPGIIAFLEPVLMRVGLGLNAAVKSERRCWLSASAVVLITAKGDTPTYWFSAGRTYLKTSLTIEDLGLSQATTAAVVEASNYHEDIEERLGTNQRILAVLRVGKGSPNRRYSPRVDPATIISTTSS